MEKDLDKLLNKGNKVLVTLVIGLFCMVLGVQVIFTYEPLRLYFNVAEKIEGQKIEEDILVHQAAGLDITQDFISITMDTPYVYSLPLATILINGNKTADFTNLENKIFVSEGDKITIDISPYSLDLSFKVNGSEGLKVPNSLIVDSKSKYTFIVDKVK